MTTVVIRRRFLVRGIVQGVGFRPHVARLARELGVRGECRNDSACVVIEVEGSEHELVEFGRRLEQEAPPLARIDSVGSCDIAPIGAAAFTITESSAGGGVRTLVSPDTAVCAECLAECADPTDRRFRHPFITCTNCGPRLSIIRDLPYDRPVTTMAPFEMCSRCREEYADPLDRRYHAQPIGCHDCGPVLRFSVAGLESSREVALASAVDALASGAILAIKGIGGYHLACDATSTSAVETLRARKQRPAQPFAVMVADVDAAASIVDLAPDAARLLVSPARPIVLLPTLPDARVAASVAPGLDELGVMVAYAPVHHLLLADLRARLGRTPVLVMTSGNTSGEPLSYRDEDAFARLSALADGFLWHDREIAVPVEDSVIAWGATGAVPVRRSRGYAPLPVDLGCDTAPVLAAGAELKNTVALAAHGRAHVSTHVGDLEALAGRVAHGRVTAALLDFQQVAPALVVADRHPGYASRAWAQDFATTAGVPLLEVQHHHAHLASLAAEHGRLDAPLLGWVLDGTGFGCDATIWGCELLLLDQRSTVATRLGHLGPVRLPGGDGGVRHPARTALIALLDAGVDPTAVDLGLSDAESSFLAKSHALDSGLLATSSAGRLFDVVSALLGVRQRISYDAQAAIELEATARQWRRAHPDEPVVALSLPTLDGVLDPAPLIRALVTSQAEPGALAYAFHVELARACAGLAASTAARVGVTEVGLSGGVFVNRLLLALLSDALREHGLTPLTHRLVPANDGGLSLGQVAVGTRTLAHSDELNSTLREV